MTDPMELVGEGSALSRFGFRAAPMDSKAQRAEARKAMREAAACIREMVEAQNGASVAPDDRGFTSWSGGENPCPGRQVDAVWLGVIHHDQASDDLVWAHNDLCDHITSYRVLPPAPGAEDE